MFGTSFLRGTTGIICGAIALGSVGMVSTAMACEPLLPEQQIMAQSSDQTPEISGEHPLAIALTAAQQNGYVNEGTWKEDISIRHDYAESPSSATVVITQTGFLDDSVKGHKFTVNVAKTQTNRWELIDIDKEYLCYRGMGSSGLCL